MQSKQEKLLKSLILFHLDRNSSKYRAQAAAIFCERRFGVELKNSFECQVNRLPNSRMEAVLQSGAMARDCPPRTCSRYQSNN